MSENREHASRCIRFAEFKLDDKQKNAVWLKLDPMAIPLHALVKDRSSVENIKRIYCEEIDAAYDVFIKHEQKGGIDPG